MGFFINDTNTSPEPDSGQAFIDALISYSSTDGFTDVTGALKNSDVYSAVNIIATTIAQTPIESDTPLLTKMLNDKPNDLVNGFAFWSAVVSSLLIHGNAFAEILSNHQLKFIPNNHMTMLVDDDTQQVAYNYTATDGTERQIVPESVLHFKILTNGDGVTGISPLYALTPELAMQKYGTELLSQLFNSPVRGIITVDRAGLNDEAKQKIRDDFLKLSQSSGVLVTDNDMNFSPFEIDPALIKAINTNNYATNKIASVFGLPATMLGVEAEHSSVSQSLRGLYLNGLQPYFNAILSELTFKLGAHEFRFDTSNILPDDYTAQVDNATKLVQNGLMTINEARQFLNIETSTDPDTDKALFSRNYAELGTALNNQTEMKGSTNDE